MRKTVGLIRGWRYSATLLKALPSAPRRKLLRRMIGFSQTLPHRFNQPVPMMMAGLTPSGQITRSLAENEIRALADAVAAWHLRSPLGICLRRSLLRYHFLREAGIPVEITFGARLKTDQEGGGVGGHAWLTLNSLPYHESPDDYEGFVVMYQYPKNEQAEPDPI